MPNNLPKPYYETDLGRLYNADCLDILPHLEPVDAVVTDPPYGLNFMGKHWDRGVPGPHFWESIIAKPGCHMFAFGGTRTAHRLACAIEDAGWEIRDTMGYLYGPLLWVFGSGFPKSKNIGCKCGGGTLQYRHENISHENMPELRQELDSKDTVSVQEKQNLLAGVCGPNDSRATVSETNVRAQNDIDDLPAMSKANMETEFVSSQKQTGLLQQILPSKTRNSSLSHSQQVRQNGNEISGDRIERPGQPCVERRGNILAQARELQADQVCPLPERVSCDGPERRLCDGTPPIDGPILTTPCTSDGSCPPQEPRPTGQQDGKPRTVPIKSGPQNSRICQACGGLIDRIGYGSALKPAYEPIIVARKPLGEKSIIENVLKYDTGALNIDKSRVGTRTENESGWSKTGRKASEER
jgi:hypothetical protein